MGWVVYEITGSGALLGAIFAVRAIPMIGLAPFAGVAADRYDRRRLLMLSQLASAATSLAFGAALAWHLVTTPMIFAFSLVMEIGRAHVLTPVTDVSRMPSSA